METVAGILLIVSLFGNWFQFDKTQDLKAEIVIAETQRDTAIDVANNNANEVQKLTEVMSKNESITRGVGADLGVCIEELRNVETTIAIFNGRRQADALAIEELESRLDGSTLDRCVVPGWLVDEIAGDPNRDDH